MEYTVTYRGELIGWARSLRLAEELIAINARENDGRVASDYDVTETYSEDEPDQEPNY